MDDKVLSSNAPSNALPHIIGVPPSRVCFALEQILKEWQRVDIERSEWSFEKSQLLARVAALEDDVKRVEREKLELQTRVAILEYGVRHERARYAVLIGKKENPSKINGKSDLIVPSHPSPRHSREMSNGKVRAMNSEKENVLESAKIDKLKKAAKNSNLNMHYFTLPSRLPIAMVGEASRELWQEYIKGDGGITDIDMESHHKNEEKKTNTPTSGSHVTRPFQPHSLSLANVNKSILPQPPLSNNSSNPSSARVFPSPLSSSPSVASSTPTSSLPPHPPRSSSSPADAANRRVNSSNSNAGLPALPISSIQPSSNSTPHKSASPREEDLQKEAAETTARIYGSIGTGSMRGNTFGRKKHADEDGDGRLPSITNAASIFAPPSEDDLPPSSTSNSAQSRGDFTTRGSTSSTLGSFSSAFRPFKPKISLRSHVDGVRHVAFDNNPSSLNSMIVGSASEDGTAKLWSLRAPLAMDAKKLRTASIEPLHTFRAHTNTVTSISLSSSRSLVATASIDHTAILWDYPALDADAYASVGRVDFGRRATLLHHGPVWSIVLPTNDALKLCYTACSDGSVYIWDLSSHGSSNTPGSMIRLPVSNDVFHIPSNVCAHQTEQNKVWASYTSGSVALMDAEKGAVIRSFSDSSQSTEPAAQWATCVASHPNNGTVYSAHADRAIRIFDPRASTSTSSAVISAHQDCVTSLSLSSDGNVCSSASHDQSIRMWDTSTRKCLQSLDAHSTHRSKDDEAIHAVALHPTLQLMASGGADSIVKIYQ